MRELYFVSLPIYQSGELPDDACSSTATSIINKQFQRSNNALINL